MNYCALGRTATPGCPRWSCETPPGQPGVAVLRASLPMLYWAVCGNLKNSFTKFSRSACCNAIATLSAIPQTREAIVIDPGDDAARILEVIERHHLKVTAIVVTHTHIDHVVGLRRVHEATGAPVYLHADDLGPVSHAGRASLVARLENPGGSENRSTRARRRRDSVGQVRSANSSHARTHARTAFACTCRRICPPRLRTRAPRSPPARNRPTICRGHAIRRQHRPHRSLGRFVRRESYVR